MLELATIADWKVVKRLSVQIHDMHAQWRPDIYYHSDEPLPYEYYHELIHDKMIYVAKVGGIIAGYVTLSISNKGGEGTHPKKVMRIDSICVDEAVRGHGIGTQMVQDVRVLCHAFGCDSLILGVHPENDCAVNFYQKCGFRIRTINMEM